MIYTITNSENDVDESSLTTVVFLTFWTHLRGSEQTSILKLHKQVYLVSDVQRRRPL